MGKAETNLTNHMRKDAKAIYGERLVLVKQHGTEYSRSGASDLLGCLDGAFFACEVKAPESYGDSVERALRDGPTTLQRAFVGHVQEASGYGWFAATRQQFLEGLAAIDAINREQCAYCRYPEDYDVPCTVHPDNKPAIL
jgi:hypothetical protein